MNINAPSLVWVLFAIQRSQRKNCLKRERAHSKKQGHGCPLLNMMSHVVNFFIYFLTNKSDVCFFFFLMSNITGHRFPLPKNRSWDLKKMKGEVTIMKHSLLHSFDADIANGCPSPQALTCFSLQA